MNIVFNGEPRQAADDTTIAELLGQLELTPQHVAVEVNLEVVPRASHAQYVLRDGDRVEVVTLVGGG